MCTLAAQPHPTFACAPGVRRFKPRWHQHVPTRHHEVHVAYDVAVGLRWPLALWWQLATSSFSPLLHHVTAPDLKLERESNVTAIGIVLPGTVGAKGRTSGTDVAVAGSYVARPVDSHELGESTCGERGIS